MLVKFGRLTASCYCWRNCRKVNVTKFTVNRFHVIVFWANIQCNLYVACGTITGAAKWMQEETLTDHPSRQCYCALSFNYFINSWSEPTVSITHYVLPRNCRWDVLQDCCVQFGCDRTNGMSWLYRRMCTQVNDCKSTKRSTKLRRRWFVWSKPADAWNRNLCRIADDVGWRLCVCCGAVKRCVCVLLKLVEFPPL